jgi:4-hydroxy-tetrahydrodipicolinate reductase
MAIRLGIIGAAGRMGRRIGALACEDEDFSLACAIERTDHPAQGVDFGELIGLGSLELPVSSRWSERPEVLIDFTTPKATVESLLVARKDSVPTVIGTTGLNAEQLSILAEAAKDIPVLHAANMSLGINLLFQLVQKVAVALGEDYDIEITETHHRFKKDAPSGTAMELANQICKATGRDIAGSLTHGRSGPESARQSGNIGIHARRQGDVIGEHAVAFGTLGETIELSHKAHSRDIFARGALKAAAWLVGRKAGLYNMLHVLNLETAKET